MNGQSALQPDITPVAPSLPFEENQPLIYQGSEKNVEVKETEGIYLMSNISKVNLNINFEIANVDLKNFKY